MSTQGGQELSEAVKSAPRTPVLLAAGMSGIGCSTALTIREDIGDQGFADFPASLVPALLADGPAIAVGADTRTRGFAAEPMLVDLAHVVSHSGRERCIVFTDCDDDWRERRYTDARRPHPLAGDRPIMDGIRRKRRMLPALRDRADLLIDISALTTELNRLLTGHFALDAIGLRVFVTCFAGRHATD